MLDTPDDERKIFETCRRQEEVNYNINLKSAFCWLTLRNCFTMHETKNIKSEYVPRNTVFFNNILVFFFTFCVVPTELGLFQVLIRTICKAEDLK